MYESGIAPELPALNAETAARVAQYFRIEVYGVEHGHTAQQLAAMFPGINPDIFPTTVTDQQRATTQVLADRLGPGDVLFREAYGYSEQPADTQTDETQAPSAEERRLAKEMLTAEQQKFDAISYGATHAILNGAHVMYADCDAQQQAMHEAANIGFASNSDSLDKDRDQAALATLIKYAIDHLPSEDAPIPEPEQRRYLMLFLGGSHIDRIKAQAAAANLPITVHTTEETKTVAAQLLAATYLAGSLQGLLGIITSNSGSQQSKT